MNEKGKNANEWLNEITKDQNLEKLEDVQLTGLRGLRRWFASRILGYNFNMGYYDHVADRIVPGPFSPSLSSEFTTTSAAASTLTCPAGYKIKITFAGAVNATQISTVSLTVTVGGITPNFPLVTRTVTSTTELLSVIGGSSMGATGLMYTLPDWWLDEGETATMTLNTYAAGNNTEHLWRYEIYRK